MVERAEVRGGDLGCLQVGKERKESTQCPLGPQKAPVTSQTVPAFPSHTTTAAPAFLACSRDPLGHCWRVLLHSVANKRPDSGSWWFFGEKLWCSLCALPVLLFSCSLCPETSDCVCILPLNFFQPWKPVTVQWFFFDPQNKSHGRFPTDTFPVSPVSFSHMKILIHRLGLHEHAATQGSLFSFGDNKASWRSKGEREYERENERNHS